MSNSSFHRVHYREYLYQSTCSICFSLVQPKQIVTHDSISVIRYGLNRLKCLLVYAV